MTRPMSAQVPALLLEVGPELYRELVTDFRDQLAVQMAELRAAALLGDVASARRVAHQLKGTAPSFGALDIDRLADRLLALAAGDAATLESVVAEIDREVARFRETASDGGT